MWCHVCFVLRCLLDHRYSQSLAKKHHTESVTQRMEDDHRATSGMIEKLVAYIILPVVTWSQVAYQFCQKKYRKSVVKTVSCRVAASIENVSPGNQP